MSLIATIFYMKRQNNWLKFNVIVLGILLLTVLFSIWITHKHLSTAQNALIPTVFTNKLNFTVFYPKHLPAGYYVDVKSFQREGSVLVFNILSPQGRSIGVSQQSIPSNMPLHQSQTPVEIPGEKSFETNAGKGHIGLWGDKYVADIVTKTTWIIVNVTNFNVDQGLAIANAFTEM